MKQLHPIQIKILKKLLFSKSLHYSEIKPDKRMDNNQFDFHLDALIKGNYITKNAKDYSLTNFGKEYANRIDESHDVVKQQAKIGVAVTAYQGKEEKEFLIFTRLKQPFYGCQGFMSGKVTYGEKVFATAKREFKEESNLTGDPVLVVIKHYRVYDKKSNDLVEDKFLYFFKMENVKGKLESNEEGKFEWIKESDFQKYITNPYDSFEVFMQEIDYVKNFDGNIKFIEVDAFVDKF